MFKDLISSEAVRIAAPAVRRPRAGAAVLLLGGVYALAGPASAAALFSPAKGVATLSVTYTLTGRGVDRPASHVHNVTWSISDRYETKVTMIAQTPVDVAGLHAAGANGEAPAPPAGSDDPQVMMQRVKDAMEKCGDDQGCLQREVMGKSAPAPVKGWSGPRYQGFSGDKQSGSFHVDEKAHQAMYDAACSSKNETPCAYDTAVTGDGAVTDGQGNTTWSTPLMAEIDLAGGSLAFYLPRVGVAKVTRTVTTQNKQIKAGSFEAMRGLTGAFDDKQVRATCGECRSASGQITREIKDELLGKSAKLVIEWKFSRP